ncbi:hypothetical protein ACIQU6_14950 [Streptomyces sp. NPDC090442]|uniref:hypothetical protein n=1 Tax=Streptomyces sp. NPDC090442 TaxID=3365962 RepID=UPI003829CCE7
MSTKPEPPSEPGPETDSTAGATREPRDASAAPQPHTPAPAEPSTPASPAPNATAAATEATPEATSEPAPEPTAARRRPDPRSAAALIFDDPLSQRPSDDTDRGWGERPTATGGAADLARFLDEKPPHHL